MAFAAQSDKAGPRSEVNVTPLIDIVLVLLIIFMVLTPVTLKHMKPTLAKDSPSAAPPVQQPVVVELSPSGDVSVDGEATSWESLLGAVRRRLTASRQGTVFFKIADDAGYGRAVQLMDVCKAAGARVLGITTTPG